MTNKEENSYTFERNIPVSWNAKNRIDFLHKNGRVKKDNLFQAIGKMDITVLILLILFPVFVIVIGWRLIAYYLSDDFQKGYWLGKISFVSDL